MEVGQIELGQALGIALFDGLGARWSYYAAFVVLALSLPLIVHVAVRYLWPSLGQPVSKWVVRTRRHASAEDSARLMGIRSTLGTLAHDVLKHRLLGLVSLVQSLDALERETATGSDSSEDTTLPKGWEGLRAELLRLCGARAAPNDRLWARWTEAFETIRGLSGGRIAPPWADESLRKTDKTLRKLRRMVRAFVAGERESALSPERVRRLDLPAIEDVHGAVLRISEGCRPELRAADIVDEALSAVGSLTGRRRARERVKVHIDTTAKWLGNAPSRLLATALERLLDNALRLSPDEAPIAVVVEVEADELLGDEVLIIRVLDTLSKVPVLDDFGTGLTNARRDLGEFECGLSFTSSDGSRWKDVLGPEADLLVKEASITVPVVPAETLSIARRASVPWATSLISFFLLIGLAVLSTSRILGGAPVQFAGGGDPVVEFRVEVGEELTFALCEGGAAPRVSVDLEASTCRAPGCTLAAAVERLEPCRRGLEGGECPGEFRWTPQFRDGSRQGESYELTVSCRADGPPLSEDVRRVRLVVSRPNRPPTFVSLHLTDEESDDRIRKLVPGRDASIAAGGSFVLRALANDDDDDALRFVLEIEGQPPTESFDGVFDLGELDWLSSGEWRAKIRVTDDVSEPVEREVKLRAGTLRPVRLQSFEIRDEEAPEGEELACVGPQDARLCEIVDGGTYRAMMKVWFDPLLAGVSERIALSAADDAAVTVVPRIDDEGGGPVAGWEWEVRERYDERLLATVSLTEVPPDSVAGARQYGFEIAIEDSIPRDPQSWTLRFGFSETSERSADLGVTLVLARSDVRPALRIPTHTVRLREWTQEGERRAGRATVQVFQTVDELPAPLGAPQLTCDDDALTSAFEPPRLDASSQRSWLLTVALNPGCIDGLGGPQSLFGDAKCRVDVATTDGAERASVRVKLEDRSCFPTITRLEPVTTTELRPGELASYQVEVSDPDGDLDPRDVTVTGLSEWSVGLEPDPSSAGSLYRGTISGTVDCGDLRKPMALEVRDRARNKAAQKIEIDMACEPLVRTVEGVRNFTIDEGERVDVALDTGADVTLALDSGLGRLEDRRFTWEGTCDNGRGPHKVVIQGEHDDQYGDPLELAIEVARCRVRLQLMEKGRRVESDQPFVLEKRLPRRLRIVPERARVQDLNFELQVVGGDANISASTLDAQGQPDFFDIQCREEGTTTLEVTATPKDSAGAHLPSETLRLALQCVPRGTLPRHGAGSGGVDDRAGSDQ